MLATLYHYGQSSSSWRARFALAHKQIPYESVIIDLRSGEQHTPEFRQKSPMGYVPALAIDGRLLTESVALIEYLEETRPEPPLLPIQPWLRARVRQVVQLVNSGVQPLQNLAVVERHSDDKEERRLWIQHFNRRAVEALEPLLEQIAGELRNDGLPDGPFVAGNQLTMAEIYLVPQLATARRFGIDVGQFPRLAATEQAALATHAGQVSLPENFGG